MSCEYIRNGTEPGGEEVGITEILRLIAAPPPRRSLPAHHQPARALPRRRVFELIPPSSSGKGRGDG